MSRHLAIPFTAAEKPLLGPPKVGRRKGSRRSRRSTWRPGTAVAGERASLGAMEDRGIVVQTEPGGSL
jgi:hypothetical protein